MNVSGGEPREVQLNVREEPIVTIITGDDATSITGGAVKRDKGD